MIKVGIIGCGKITQVRHAPEYAENADCKLVAFYDVVKERAEELAKEYGGVAYDSIEELLSSDVDAVSVCVANVAHCAVSVQALKAGKHVLCEKPMATTLEDCETMVEEAKKSGKILMIGLNQRLAKAHVKAKELIESGELGTLISFQTNFCHPGPEGWTGVKDSWFFDKKLAAFGAMADLGVHKTDMFHYVTGHKIVETTAVMGVLDKKFSDGTPITVDDNSFCIYKTDKGAIGTMHVGWTNYGMEDNSTIFQMTGGVIKVYADPKYSLIVEKPDGTVDNYELDLLTSNKEQTTGGRTTTGVIDMFIDSVKNNVQPPLCAESALHAMKVIFASEKSAETKQTVVVE